MEYEELKTLWDKYDSKLNNLERLNKKLITETLIKKPQKKLNWYKFSSLYGLIATPIILIVALHESFKMENIDLLFIIGGVLLISFVLYICYTQYKCYLSLKSIDLQNDSAIASAEKVNRYKEIVNNQQRLSPIVLPLIFMAVLMLNWKVFHFNSHTILFNAGLLLFIFVLGYVQKKKFNSRIENLKKDILDLEEYK
jgi:hypothetical protein